MGFSHCISALIVAPPISRIAHTFPGVIRSPWGTIDPNLVSIGLVVMDWLWYKMHVSQWLFFFFLICNNSTTYGHIWVNYGPWSQGTILNNSAQGPCQSCGYKGTKVFDMHLRMREFQAQTR